MSSTVTRLPIQLFKMSCAMVFAMCLFALLTHPAFAASAPGPAKTLGEMTSSIFGSLLSLQAFFSLLSYILGAYFTVTGLINLRNHVLSPDQNPLFQALSRIIAASFFIFAPDFANILANSIGNDSLVSGSGQLALNYQDAASSGTSSTGLEGSLTRFITDFATPFLEDLLPFFCYLAGLVFMLIGLNRLAKGSFEGPRDPSAMGTFGTFFVAATLMSLGYIMYTLNFSMFGLGSDDVWSNPLVKSASGTDPAMEARMNQLMWGVFIFLRIVGYISVVRGLFMLRGAAEGQQVSMMSVATHLVAGAMLANATAFVLLVQTTFVADQNDFILK